jgi:hypothetical protein
MDNDKTTENTGIETSTQIVSGFNTDTLITSLDELKLESALLFKNAKRKVQIYSHNLDPRILNHPKIESALKDFIRSSRYAKVEILIYDERNMQNVDHRLVRLAQNFTSNVTIKVVPKDYHENHFAFYLVDDRKILYRSSSERFETEYLQVPNSKINEKSHYFSDIWQKSDPASHLRALHL